jgi:hypothetical protein
MAILPRRTSTVKSAVRYDRLLGKLATPKAFLGFETELLLFSREIGNANLRSQAFEAQQGFCQQYGASAPPFVCL